jgi:type VI protein secretion system component VasF
MNALFAWAHSLRGTAADDALLRWQPAHDYSTPGWGTAGWALFIVGCVLVLAAGFGILLVLPGVFILQQRWRFNRRRELLERREQPTS